MDLAGFVGREEEGFPKVFVAGEGVAGFTCVPKVTERFGVNEGEDLKDQFIGNEGHQVKVSMVGLSENFTFLAHSNHRRRKFQISTRPLRLTIYCKGCRDAGMSGIYK